MAGLTDLAELRLLLEKRATFERAVRALRAAVVDGTPDGQAVMQLATRVHVLLRTRYSGVGYWRAGHDLFAVCHQVQ